MKRRMLALGLATVLPAVLTLPVIDHALDAASPAMAASLAPEAPVSQGSPLGTMVVANGRKGSGLAGCGLAVTTAGGGQCAPKTVVASTTSGSPGGLFAAGGPLATKSN